MNSFVFCVLITFSALFNPFFCGHWTHSRLATDGIRRVSAVHHECWSRNTKTLASQFFSVSSERKIPASRFCCCCCCEDGQCLEARDHSFSPPWNLASLHCVQYKTHRRYTPSGHVSEYYTKNIDTFVGKRRQFSGQEVDKLIALNAYFSLLTNSQQLTNHTNDKYSSFVFPCFRLFQTMRPAYW